MSVITTKLENEKQIVSCLVSNIITAVSWLVSHPYVVVIWPHGRSLDRLVDQRLQIAEQLWSLVANKQTRLINISQADHQTSTLVLVTHMTVDAGCNTHSSRMESISKAAGSCQRASVTNYLWRITACIKRDMSSYLGYPDLRRSEGICQGSIRES